MNCVHICGTYKTYKNFLNGQTSSRVVELKISLAHSWPNWVSKEFDLKRAICIEYKNYDDFMDVQNCYDGILPAALKMDIMKSHSPWKMSTMSYKHHMWLRTKNVSPSLWVTFYLSPLSQMKAIDKILAYFFILLSFYIPFPVDNNFMRIFAEYISLTYILYHVGTFSF